MLHRALVVVVVASASILASAVANAARQPAEKLDRGVIAVNEGDGKVFVSWRLLNTDASDVAFDVYASSSDAKPRLLNAKPIDEVTFFEQTGAKLDVATTYTVVPHAGAAGTGAAAARDVGFTMPANAPVRQYLEVPLKTPDGYTPGDCSAADLDGDGQYELIVHFTGRGHDNSQKGPSDPPILAAYKLDGTELWRINLGPNIREGAHYTQFQVFDYDGDGKAELICKTADGTVDASGKVIGDPKARWANDDGYILKGPEFLTVFNGQTGAAIDTIPYQPSRAGPGKDGSDVSPAEIKATWGDAYGNRVDRFLAATAYLDGVHPSAVMCRGYYTRTCLWAVDFDGKKLKTRWLFDSENPSCTQRGQRTAPSTWDPSKVQHAFGEGNHTYSGQGYHSVMVADVDGDGKDEIIYGSMTVDDDGTGLYTTGFGHGDSEHVGDLDPDHPGLEIFGIQERFDDAGAHLHDAKTGALLFKRASVKAAETGGDKGEGPARGVAFNIDPTHPGCENWTAGAGIEGLYDIKGNKIGDEHPSSCNFRVFWDGDPLDELLDKNHIDKWNWQTKKTERLFTADGAESINGTKATPCLSADLFGDWREEVVLRSSDNKSLRIYTTTIPTPYRVVTLMQDPQYRESIAWQNTAYNQPPHLGYDLERKLQPRK